DEFARERTRQVFYSRYAPALRDFAPRPPVDVVYLQEAMLDPYASERGAFPVKQVDSVDFQQRVHEAGLIPAPTFSLSGLFWPIDPANAEAVLKSLPNRRAKTAATYEIASLDPASKRLVIRLKA